MKQKKLNNILYVFDVNPYEITQDTDAEVIKVQEESYKGFVEMNQDLAEKIVSYNYHTMCVNVPEWAPYVEQEDPQGSLTFGIYGSAAADAINQIQVQNADNVILQSWTAGVDLTFPFQCNVEEGQHCAVECKEGISDLFNQFDVTGAEYLPVHWIDQETGHHWYATSPITDSISIGINAASPAEITVTAPHGLEIYDEKQDTWVDVYQDSENPELEHGNLVVGRTYSVDKRGIGQGKVVVFNPECGTGSQGIVGAQFIAPETDLVITLADAPVSTHEVVINSDIAMSEIMEQTPDHQTIVNTYTSPSSPFNMTVNDGNIVTVEFDNGEPAYKYNVSPNGFFAGQWKNPDTGKYISWSEPISDDVNVTIQPRTYTFVLEGSNIHQNATVKVNGETTSYTPEQLVDGVQLNDGDVIDVYPTQNVADYSLVSGATWDTDHWTATVNGANVDIWINYTEPASTYTVTLDGGSVHQAVTVKMNGETVPVDLHYQNVADGTVVDVYPTGNVADYALQSGAVWDTDHWTATVNGADLTITINYYGVGVNFNASWFFGSTPENVDEILIGSTSVTGNDLTNKAYSNIVRLYPGSSQIKYFISTGLPTDMTHFDIKFMNYWLHYSYKQTNPDTGEVFYSDAADASGATLQHPGIWTYDNNPDSGLPWIAFTLPEVDENGNAFVDNTLISIDSKVTGS